MPTVNPTGFLALGPAAVSLTDGAWQYLNGTGIMNTRAGGALGGSPYDSFGALVMGTMTVGGANMPAGTYTFGLMTDDGSCFWIDLNRNGIFETSELVVNHPNANTGAVGTVTLAAGTYDIAITMYESAGGERLEAAFRAGTHANYAALGAGRSSTRRRRPRPGSSRPAATSSSCPRRARARCCCRPTTPTAAIRSSWPAR